MTESRTAQEIASEAITNAGGANSRRARGITLEHTEKIVDECADGEWTDEQIKELAQIIHAVTAWERKTGCQFVDAE